MSTKRDLIQIKELLGEIQLLDYRGVDLTTAHHMLGVEVGPQARKILKNKLLQLTRENFYEQVRNARLYQNALKTRSSTNDTIRPILDLYLQCLIGWSDGANLLETDHEYIKGTSREEITNLDLGLFLQNENVGCQTGVYRLKTGDVLGWHTEEDIEEELNSRFDKLRIAVFSHFNSDVYVFVYPDLMPGPAYCWRSDLFFQMVDTLYLKHGPDEKAIPANIATWVSLFLGQRMHPAELLKPLGPFVDGYSFTTVYSSDHRVHAEKVELGGDKIKVSNLRSEAGDFLFQVNLVSDEDSEIAQLEGLTKKQKKKYQKRILQTHQMVKNVRDSDDMIQSFLDILCTRSTRDNEMGYSNKDVKSYILFMMSAQNLDIWYGAGPAMKKDTLAILSFALEG